MPRSHALLIGIDRYRFSPGRSLVEYPDLGGCIHDVARAEEVLCRDWGVEPERVRKLLSPLPGVALPSGEPELPTYENLVSAIRRLAREAEPGEAVWIHFSGHGGRVPTAFPAIKGYGAFDETWVPCDVHHSGARHLRDLELASLLRQLVERRLRVTVISDCCHSGGMPRLEPGGERLLIPRGISAPDSAHRPPFSAVAPWAELAPVGLMPGARATLRSAASRSRKGDAQRGGMVLLMASRATEAAHERDFASVGRAGLLTHHLYRQLADSGAALTYQELYEALLGEWGDWIAVQTPTLEGEANWRVLSGESGRWAPAVRLPGLDASEQDRSCALQIDLSEASAAEELESLAERVRAGASRFLTLTESGEADLCVSASAAGGLRAESLGGDKLPWSEVVLEGEESWALDDWIERLAHLARYRLVASLTGATERWESVALERVEIDGRQIEGIEGQRENCIPGPAPGERLTLRLRNDSQEEWNLVLLTFRPDGAVEQLFPPPYLAAFRPLAPGEEALLSIEQAPAEEAGVGWSLLRLLGSLQPLDLRSLQLPPLGETGFGALPVRGSAGPGTALLRGGSLEWLEDGEARLRKRDLRIEAPRR